MIACVSCCKNKNLTKRNSFNSKLVNFLFAALVSFLFSTRALVHTKPIFGRQLFMDVHSHPGVWMGGQRKDTTRDASHSPQQQQVINPTHPRIVTTSTGQIVPNYNMTKYKEEAIKEIQNSCLIEVTSYLRPLQQQWMKKEVPILQNMIQVKSSYFAFFNMKGLRKLPNFGNVFDFYCDEKLIKPEIDSHHHTMVIECGNAIPQEIRVVQKEEHTNGAFHPNETYNCSKFVQCLQKDPIELQPPLPKASGSLTIGNAPTFPNNMSQSAKNQAQGLEKIQYAACTSINNIPSNAFFLAQWIEYHSVIGFQHFIIYLNTPTTPDMLEWLPYGPHITYIPFDHNAFAPFFFQQGQQNECIYRARQWDIDWLALHDIDEYFQLLDGWDVGNKKKKDDVKNTTSPKASDVHNTSSVSPPSVAPWLDLVMKTHSSHNVSAISIKHWFFGRHPNKGQQQPLLIDYDWRKNAHEDINTIMHRMKLIVRPTMVSYVSVHEVSSKSKVVLLMNPPKAPIRMNHYKNAHVGVYTAISNIVHDSSLKESTSRVLLVQRLKVLHNMTLEQYVPIKTNTKPTKYRVRIVQK